MLDWVKLEEGKLPGWLVKGEVKAGPPFGDPTVLTAIGFAVPVKSSKDMEEN